MSWPRVFLKVRRALIESSWEECLEGVKRYARYCQEAGIEGSAFVVSPARFFEDEIYLESLTFQAAEDPKVAEHRAKKLAERVRVESEASLCGVQFDSRDSTESIQTRIEIARNQRPSRAALPPEISTRIGELSARMRIAK